MNKRFDIETWRVLAKSDWPRGSAGAAIADAVHDIDMLTDALDAALAALRSIYEHPHCMYENNTPTDYGRGVTDGHRCAATIAREALKRIDEMLIDKRSNEEEKERNV